MDRETPVGIEDEVFGQAKRQVGDGGAKRPGENSRGGMADRAPKDAPKETPMSGIRRPGATTTEEGPASGATPGGAASAAPFGGGRRGLAPLLPALALAAVSSGCGGERWPAPPPTRVGVVVDTLHGVEVPDPYRWLEEQDSAETRAWIAAQNAYAREVVADAALTARLQARLSELMDTASVGAPRRAGDREIFTLRRPGEPQARIVSRPAPEEGAEPVGAPRPAADGDYETLVDPAALGYDDAASVDIVDVSPDGSLLLFRIRDGGLDEISVHLFDLGAGEVRPDSLPEALYGTIAFDGEGEGFYAVHRSRETGPRVLHHRIGDAAGEAVELFGEGYGPQTFLRVEEIRGGEWLLVGAQHGWARNEVFLLERASGAVHPVFAGEDAHLAARYADGRLLLHTDWDAPNYRVLSAPVEGVAPERWADRSRWTEWIPEGEQRLTRYTTIGGRTYAHYLADTASRIVAYEADEDGEDGAPLRAVGEVPLPPLHTASIESAGDSEDTAVLTLRSFTSPEARYRLDLETRERELIEPPRPDYDGGNLVVEQVFYTSTDGARAPMTLLRRRDVEPDGETPTLLHGYGGFDVSLTPAFRAQAAVWAEAGGVHAVATLRGGGEYGEEWHRAGMLGNKQQVFDDFLSAAEWLVDNGVTNPARLAITGASNGGLLVASAFTQRPDLFRAVFCGFPDLDMVRFFTFRETNNLPALLEYGNAEKAEEFEFLLRYSPYQAVRDGVDYPAVMLTQGDLDTRVPPLQARKMTARLQAASSSGLPVILRYDERAGHAGGRPRAKVVADVAMETAFLMTQVGLEFPSPE